MHGADAGAFEAAVVRLRHLAERAGLRPGPVRFELAPAAVVCEIAAYGLPGRFAHWSHGKAYRALRLQHAGGLVQHFEVVVHGNPACAFLVQDNDSLTNRLVAAHVLGHADFFAANACFASAPRDMPARAPVHAARLREHALAHGHAAVEALLDAALALEAHVDPSAGAPPASGPGAPDEDDLLLYLARHAPALQPWERDVLGIVRAEALYLRPQARTRIMNEGWATFWHARLLRALPLRDAEYVDFARLHAAVCAPGVSGVNPYLLGSAIYEDVLRRLGPEAGMRECFLAREVEEDAGFLRNHLTAEVARALGLRLRGPGATQGAPAEAEFPRLRDALVRHCEAGGRPVIAVAGPDGRGELVLEHRHDGRDLDMPDAERALGHVARLWGRRCRLRTRLGGERRELVGDPPQQT